jgi:hypothetical protein
MPFSKSHSYPEKCPNLLAKVLNELIERRLKGLPDLNTLDDERLLVSPPEVTTVLLRIEECDTLDEKSES